MKIFIPFLTGISAIGWHPDQLVGGPTVQPLDCYHCTYRENSDGTTFGNEACQDVSDPEKSKPFKITIPNRFYNVTEPTPVVYRYDCATYWITGTRYESKHLSSSKCQGIFSNWIRGDEKDDLYGAQTGLHHDPRLQPSIRLR